MSLSDAIGPTVRFTAALVAVPDGLGTFVFIPEDVVAAVGARGRTSVAGTIDGRPFKNQFMPYTFEGEGKRYAMAVNKAVRAEIGGKGPGDAVEFVLRRDATPRGSGRA
jgi:Domain of unknown function (DUF1905)